MKTVDLNSTERQTYVSPEVTSIVIESEGVLCGSPVFDSPGNGYGSNDLGDI